MKKLWFLVIVAAGCLLQSCATQHAAQTGSQIDSVRLAAVQAEAYSYGAEAGYSQSQVNYINSTEMKGNWYNTLMIMQQRAAMRQHYPGWFYFGMRD